MVAFRSSSSSTTSSLSRSSAISIHSYSTIYNHLPVSIMADACWRWSLTAAISEHKLGNWYVLTAAFTIHLPCITGLCFLARIWLAAISEHRARWRLRSSRLSCHPSSPWFFGFLHEYVLIDASLEPWRSLHPFVRDP